MQRESGNLSYGSRTLQTTQGAVAPWESPVRKNIAALSKVSSAYPLYLIYSLADTIIVNRQLSIVNFYFGMVMVSTI